MLLKELYLNALFNDVLIFKPGNFLTNIAGYYGWKVFLNIFFLIPRVGASNSMFLDCCQHKMRGSTLRPSNAEDLKAKIRIYNLLYSLTLSIRLIFVWHSSVHKEHCPEVLKNYESTIYGVGAPTVRLQFSEYGVIEILF